MKGDSVILFPSLILCCILSMSCNEENDITLAENSLIEIVDNLKFAEGPAYHSGNLFFSDIDAEKIYKWNNASGLSVFRENTGRANGLCFDNDDNLVICEGGNKRIVSISQTSELRIITDEFSNKPYNEPNDLWISPVGNIYFTDPVFTGTLSQDGEHIYCILAVSGEVIRVTDDLVKPNGITGNKDGSVLYIADYGASSIYRYNVRSDGTLENKQLFAAIKADGIDTDSDGNLYAASDGIRIYNPSGNLIKTITVSGTTTNICIAEEEIRTLYITTHSTVYKYIINQ
jgi:gluconolactonase